MQLALRAFQFSTQKTMIGPLTNYLQFTAFSYRVGIVRYLLNLGFMTSCICFLSYEKVIKIKHHLEEIS